MDSNEHEQTEGDGGGDEEYADMHWSNTLHLKTKLQIVTRRSLALALTCIINPNQNH